MTVIGVAVAVGVCGMLTPEGDTKKYVRLVGALCLICALASPWVGAIARGELSLENMLEPYESETENYEEIYKNSLKEGAKINAENVIEECLIKQFELSADSLEVSLQIVFDGGEYTVESAYVLLKHSAVFADPRDISEYINGELGCPCYVVYD